jgi:putative membrane protein
LSASRTQLGTVQSIDEVKMKWYLAGVAALHVLFMVCEMYPWRLPILLRKASESRLPGYQWADPPLPFVATIVHNAGIYNGILAGGLFWAAFVRGGPADDVARVLLAGATVAGVFGTVTLKSWPTAVQALLAIVGLLLL